MSPNIDNKTLWSACLAELELTLSKASFQTWFKDKTTIINVNNSIMEVDCNSSYTKDWLETRYQGKVKEILDRLTGTSNNVIFRVGSVSKPKVVLVKKDLASQKNLFEEDKETIKGRLIANLNGRYTFANFVVGNSNKLAFAVASSVAKNLATAYNPLFIYGGVGVGKTHLMQAIGNEIQKNFPSLKVLYCTSETFTNELVEAIQNRKTSSFHQKFRTGDCLLIDDIAFIAGREATQEEFFHTFNQLHSQSKQIVITSDRPPKSIAKLADRLRSRFEGGMIVDISPPDRELKEAIIRAKCQYEKIALDPEVISFIAQNLGASIRDLEGTLLQLKTHASLNQKEFDLTLAQEVLNLSRANIKKRFLNHKDIIDTVAEYFSLKVAELKSPRRSREVVLPRHIAYYLLRKEGGLTLTKIASLLNKKDHTTVIHGIRKISSTVEKSTEIRGLVEEITEHLYES